MLQKVLYPSLISSLLVAAACSAPNEPHTPNEPPKEHPAPVFETDTRLDVKEGSEFIHRVVVKSEAPTVALSLEDAPQGLTLTRDGLDGLLTWTPDFDQAGEYAVTLAAIDEQDPPRTASVTLTIIVANTNRAPTTPVLTTDANFPIATSASFTVEAVATDPDGDEVTWTWTVSEPSWQLEVDGASVTVTAPAERGTEAILTATASDAEASVSATLDLSTIPNFPPGKPVIATETQFPVMYGVVASLTALSEDPNDDPVTYEWSVAGDDWELVADGATATVKTNERGSDAVLTVTASDGELTASATYALSSFPNRAPSTPEISTEATLPLASGNPVAFTATATDPDADVLTWAWTVSDPENWSLGRNGAIATVLPVRRGTTAVLTATASDGELTASATYELSSAANASPSVSIDAPDTLVVGSTIELTAVGLDDDNDELSYQWSADGEDWSYTSTGAVMTLTAPTELGASVTVTVTARDVWGGSATTTHTLTTRGVTLNATVDFLQTGSFTLETSRTTEPVFVDDNGPLEFTQKFVPGDTWAITSQPSDQGCSVKGETSGEIASEDVVLAITCTVIEQKQAAVSTTLQTTSTTYEPVPNIDSIPVEMSKPGYALVTLTVPFASGEGANRVWFAITVDGVPVEEALVENRPGGTGAPAGIISTVPLSAGSRVIQAMWRADGGTKAQIHNVGSVVFTATVIESLPKGMGGVHRTASPTTQIGGADAQSFYQVGSISVSKPAKALLSAQVSAVRTAQLVSFEIFDNPYSRGTGGFRKIGSSHVPLLALQTVSSAKAYSLRWKTVPLAYEVRAWVAGHRVSMAAALFEPDAIIKGASTSSINTNESSFTRVGSSLQTLKLSEPKSVLVLLQSGGVGLVVAGGKGEVAIRMNGQVASLAEIRSEGRSDSNPLAMSRIFQLGAGDYEFDVAARSLSSENFLRSWEGAPNFVVVVLD